MGTETLRKLDEVQRRIDEVYAGGLSALLRERDSLERQAAKESRENVETLEREETWMARGFLDQYDYDHDQFYPPNREIEGYLERTSLGDRRIADTSFRDLRLALGKEDLSDLWGWCFERGDESPEVRILVRWEKGSARILRRLEEDQS